MLVVGLDESGSFEGKGSAVKIIAGFVYYEKEGQTSSEEEESLSFVSEKLRIEQFLKKQCELLNISYPKGIHAMEIDDKYKKNKLKEALKQYIKKNGNYHFTIMIKGRTPKKGYEGFSNLVDEKEASNLYEHMLLSLLNNILFYNPKFQSEEQVVLELATRSIPVPNSDVENLLKYKRLGYSSALDKKGNTIFYLTDQRSFKTALLTKMVEDNIKRNIIFDINVQSINYYKTAKDMNRDTTPWLYIADLSCDIIREYLSPGVYDFNLEKLFDKAVNITGNEPLLWAYDDMDDCWGQMYESFVKEDYIGCIKALYETENLDSDFKAFYRNHWFENIQKQADNLFNIDDILNYVDAVKDIISKDTVASEQNEKDINFGLYLGEQIFQRVIHEFKNEINDKLIYKLSDLLLMGYNHAGNINKARYFYECCRELRQKVEPEDFCGTLLSAAQLYANQFQFDEAIQIIERDRLFVEKLKKDKKMLRDMYGDEIAAAAEQNFEFKYELLGKVYSSLGQFYSFKKDKDTAINYFEKALEEFEKASFNRELTISFMLQLALDSKDKTLYDKYVEEYLDFKELNKQLDFVLERQDAFKLLIFIKSLNIFKEEIDKEIIEKLKTIKLESEFSQVNIHPWELIYKHLSIFFFEHNEPDKAKDFYNKIKLEMISSKDNITVAVIGLAAQCSISFFYLKDQDELRKKINEVKDVLSYEHSIKDSFNDIYDCLNANEAAERLQKNLSYLYV